MINPKPAVGDVAESLTVTTEAAQSITYDLPGIEANGTRANGLMG